VKIRTLGRVHRILYEAYHKRAGGIMSKELSGTQFCSGHVEWALKNGLLNHKLRGKYHISKKGVDALMVLEQVDAYPINSKLVPAEAGELTRDNRFQAFRTDAQTNDTNQFWSPGMISAKRGYHFVEVKVRRSKKWMEYFKGKVW
jgi:hypothetical protein